MKTFLSLCSFLMYLYFALFILVERNKVSEIQVSQTMNRFRIAHNAHTFCMRISYLSKIFQQNWYLAIVILFSLLGFVRKSGRNLRTTLFFIYFVTYIILFLFLFIYFLLILIFAYDFFSCFHFSFIYNFKSDKSFHW